MSARLRFNFPQTRPLSSENKTNHFMLNPENPLSHNEGQGQDQETNTNLNNNNHNDNGNTSDRVSRTLTPGLGLNISKPLNISGLLSKNNRTSSYDSTSSSASTALTSNANGSGIMINRPSTTAPISKGPTRIRFPAIGSGPGLGSAGATNGNSTSGNGSGSGPGKILTPSPRRALDPNTTILNANDLTIGVDNFKAPALPAHLHRLDNTMDNRNNSANNNDHNHDLNPNYAHILNNMQSHHAQGIKRPGSNVHALQLPPDLATPDTDMNAQMQVGDGDGFNRYHNHEQLQNQNQRQHQHQNEHEHDLNSSHEYALQQQESDFSLHASVSSTLGPQRLVYANRNYNNSNIALNSPYQDDQNQTLYNHTNTNANNIKGSGSGNGNLNSRGGGPGSRKHSRGGYDGSVEDSNSIQPRALKRQRSGTQSNHSNSPMINHTNIVHNNIMTSTPNVSSHSNNSHSGQRVQQAQAQGQGHICTLGQILSTDADKLLQNELEHYENRVSIWRCVDEEGWLEGAEELKQRFDAMLKKTQDHMRKKRELFKELESRIDNHQAILDARAEALKNTKENLVNQGQNVVGLGH